MIDVQGLGFQFGQTWVFRDVSFTLETGKVAAILGPNGRGKTTLIKSVVGLLKPNTGSSAPVVVWVTLRSVLRLRFPIR